MHRHYIFSGILLILRIADFAVAAPVVVQAKPRAGVDVMHIPEDAMTILGKRGSEFGALNELWPELFKDPGDFMKESSATHPSEPADGWTDPKQPIPEEPSPVSKPDGMLNELWLELFGRPESHFFGHPSSSSPLPGPANGRTDVKQPLAPMPEQPSHVSSPDYAQPNQGSSTVSDNGMVGVRPPPGSVSPIESNHEMGVPPPSSSVSLTISNSQ